VNHRLSTYVFGSNGFYQSNNPVADLRIGDFRESPIELQALRGGEKESNVV
jgi:hypothetical protein